MNVPFRACTASPRFYPRPVGVNWRPTPAVTPSYSLQCTRAQVDASPQVPAHTDSPNLTEQANGDITYTGTPGDSPVEFYAYSPSSVSIGTPTPARGTRRLLIRRCSAADAPALAKLCAEVGLQDPVVCPNCRLVVCRRTRSCKYLVCVLLGPWIGLGPPRHPKPLS